MDNSEVRHAMYNAEGYVLAAKYLQSKIYENGINLVPYSSALTMNLAFSAEIYLKVLNIILNDNKKSGHKLIDLYKSLPYKHKNLIETDYNNEINKYDINRDVPYNHLSLNECLNIYNEAFVNWRYSYERNKKDKLLAVASIDLFILVDVFKKYILNLL